MDCGGKRGGVCNVLSRRCECMLGRDSPETLCTGCAAGYYGRSCTPCPGGLGNPCSRRGTCNDRSLGTGICICTSPTFSGQSCDEGFCPDDMEEFFNTSANVFQCRRCLANNFPAALLDVLGGRMCTTCPDGRTSQAGAKSRLDCLCAGDTIDVDGEICGTCPIGATCTRGSVSASTSGYWILASSASNPAPVSCPFGEEACVGSNACAEGYTGVACAECAEGFAREGNSCGSCDGHSASAIVGIAIAFAVIALILPHIVTRPSIWQGFVRAFKRRFVPNTPTSKSLVLRRNKYRFSFALLGLAFIPFMVKARIIGARFGATC